MLFVVAQIPPQRLMALAVPLYAVGVALLIAIAVFGITKKGATRWLNVGVVIQPSEILKIAMPLMLAWWFQKREGQLRALDFVVAGAAAGWCRWALIVKQPDLGTAILILSAGLVRDLLRRPVVEADRAAAAAGRWSASSLLVVSEPTICAAAACAGRCCTTTSSTASAPCSTRRSDPLGKGFHIIQGMIAIGSGGVTGKGFMQGTQTHLEFIPERTTDFIFAAFAEEFGLVGNARPAARPSPS